MPAYDFKCTECADTFEVTRPMNVHDDVCCPSCGAAARKVFSPVGVAFKGTGFHNTDYRPKHKEEDPPAEVSAPKSDATACPAKTEGSSACAECPVAS